MGYLPKDYVPVHTRLQKLHKDHPNCSIHVTSEMLGQDTVKFTCILVLDVQAEQRQSFTGQSFCKLGQVKAFEKGETVAVGRALAFAGFEIKSGIASQDEMDKFNADQATTPAKVEIKPDPLPDANWDKVGEDLEKGLELKCKKCSSEAKFKTGDKNGKTWKGNFCQNKDCKNVEWLK